MISKVRKTMAKVSIIIPVYNMKNYLTQCLDSVIHQTLSDIEILCIDDCSTDNSLSILKEYALKDNRIKIIEQTENKGQGIARNIALDMAKGDYIMFLDPDDWLDLNACEEAYKQITKCDTDICFFDYYKFNNNKNNEEKKSKTNLFAEIKNKDNFSLADCNVNYMLHGWACTQIYKTSYIKENSIKFSDTRNCEDAPFTFIAMVLSNRVSVLEIPLYHYRTYYDGFKLSIERVSRWSEVLYNKNLVLDYIKNNSINESFLKQFVIYAINTTFDRFNAYKKLVKDKDKLYEAYRNFAIKINSCFDIKNIKNDIIYSEFIDFIISKTLKTYNFRQFINKVFSVRRNKNHIEINLLFTKLKMRSQK